MLFFLRSLGRFQEAGKKVYFFLLNFTILIYVVFNFLVDVYFDLSANDFWYSNFTNESYHSQFDQPKLTEIKKYQDSLHTFATLILKLDDLGLTPEKYQSKLNEPLLTQYGLVQELTYAAKGFQASAQRVVSGSNQLQGENVVYRTVYYQDLLHSAIKTIAALEKGDGKAAAEAFTFPGAHYAQFMDYTPWYNISRESFGGYKGNRYWGENALETYDIYDLINGIRAKATLEESSYEGKILQLKAIQVDIEKNLKNMVSQDTAMWKTAKAQLPEVLSEEIINKLK